MRKNNGQKLLFIFFLILLASIILFSYSSKFKFYYKLKEFNLEIMFTEPYHYNFHQSPIEKKIISLLNSAKYEILVMAFDLDLSSIIDTLIQKHKQGVKIKIIYDKKYTPEKVIKIYHYFNWDINYKPAKLMHHKIIIIDSKIVALGSMNFTVNGIYFNNNDFLIFYNKKIATYFRNYFNYMKKAQRKFTGFTSSKEFIINSKIIAFYLTRFNDMDVNSILLKYISMASFRIGFAYSTFTNFIVAKKILDVYKSGKSKNSKFQAIGVLEKRNTYSKYSVFKYMKDRGFKIYVDYNYAIMHNKLLIIDNNVFTGSYAIANRTNKDGYLKRYNDDLLIFFKSNPTIANIYYSYVIFLSKPFKYQKSQY